MPNPFNPDDSSTPRAPSASNATATYVGHDSTVTDDNTLHAIMRADPQNEQRLYDLAASVLRALRKEAPLNAETEKDVRFAVGDILTTTIGKNWEARLALDVKDTFRVLAHVALHYMSERVNGIAEEAARYRDEVGNVAPIKLLDHEGTLDELQKTFDALRGANLYKAFYREDQLTDIAAKLRSLLIKYHQYPMLAQHANTPIYIEQLIETLDKRLNEIALSMIAKNVERGKERQAHDDAAQVVESNLLTLCAVLNFPTKPTGDESVHALDRINALVDRLIAHVGAQPKTGVRELLAKALEHFDSLEIDEARCETCNCRRSEHASWACKSCFVFKGK